jgi:hypothetical protein
MAAVVHKAVAGRGQSVAIFVAVAASWTLALLLTVIAVERASGQAAPPSEYQVKAAFIFNFTKFIEWPASVFTSPTAPYVVGVIGDDPFDGALQKALSGQELGGRSFVTRAVTRPAEAKECHVLFIGRSEKRHLTGILGAAQDLPILTISDLDGFIKSGGIIHFYTEKQKVRFEISDTAAKRAGLKISSKLMNLGKVPDS